jgi:hypothetical protein
MGNPYYVEPQSSIGQIIDPMLKIANLQQGQAGLEQHAQQLAEAKRQHMVANYGTETPAPGAVTIPQQEINLKQQQMEAAQKELNMKAASTTPDKQQFTPVNDTRTRALLKNQTGLGNSIDTIFDTYIKPVADDPQANKGTLFDTISSQGKETVTDWLSTISKEHEAKLMKDPNYANTPQAKRTEDLMNALYASPDGSTLAKGLMPDMARYRQLEDMALAAKLNKEVNVANEIETILGGLFKGYYTDNAVRKRALDWYATPEGSAFVQKKAGEYSQSKQAPQFSPVVTNEGIIPFTTKGPGAGTFKATGGINPSKPLPESATKEFAVLSAMMADVQKVKSLYDPGYVGPVAGRYYGAKESLVGLPAQQATFNALVRNLQDTELRKRSGAAINEQEMRRLVSFLPDPKLPPETFAARLQLFEDEIRNIQVEKAATYSGQGYKIDVSTGQKTTATKSPKKIGRFTVEVE